MFKKLVLYAVLVFIATTVYGEQKEPCATESPGSPSSSQKSPAVGAQLAGSVCMVVTISESGTVRDAQVLKGVEKEVDRFAMKAVRKWKFDPAKKDGRPVAVKAAVLVNVWRKPDGELTIGEAQSDTEKD